MAAIDEIDITSLLFQEGSAPTTPASTKWRAYFKTDGLYVIDDAGTEVGPLTAGGGASTFSGASVYEAANVTGLNGTQTITWDSEHFDTDTYHDTGSNTSRLTVPSTGYYRVSIVLYVYSADAGEQYTPTIQINGAGAEYHVGNQDNPSTSNASVLSGSRVFSLTASDYVEVKLTTADTSWNLGGDTHASVFQISRLGD